MNTKVLFVVSSNFQMMFAYFLSHYMNGEVQYLILDSQNSEVNDISIRAAGNNKAWLIPSLKNTVKDLVFDNKALFEHVSDIIRKESPATVILFKDNDFLTCKVIETAAQIEAKITLVQEGVGIYRYPERNYKQWLRIKVPVILGYPWVYSFTQGMHPKVTAIAAAEPDMLPAVKTRLKEVIKIPQQAPPRHLLYEYSKILPDQTLQILKEHHSTSLLYIGQPLSKLGILKTEEETAFLQTLLLITKKNNLNLLVKPHPYEDLDKYDGFKNELTLLSHSVPAEIIPLYLSLTCVVTPYSSAADNMSTWFHTPVLYVHDLLLKRQLIIDYELKGSFVKNHTELDDLIAKYSCESMDSQKLYTEKECELDYQQFVTALLQ
ncbi:polysialyltransferase family glycosyltransferase [Metabacillus idriensis]|uniref:polysialyltransferase family glycosyltransferase n=1 Tax=Metabacillus idriensis TaxID=324768 RepID=UPI00174E3DEF|nr:polysialyltransferase family glycosyltransferase [Metabacillus idriensis]